MFVQLVEEEGEDSSYIADLGTELESVKQDLDKLELKSLLSAEHDRSSAIIEINAGAGGTESCDWAEMLFRMYARWCERAGHKITIIDRTPGDVAGSKSITAIIEGLFAYGYLKAERGVHRLVRISPFDANKRRHTSFASVDVIPELKDVGSVEIDPDDLKMDTFRASSAGGQHMQKNETAVRITHLPTRMVVTCQNERSLTRNKEVAMRVLGSRLLELKEREQAEKIEELRGERRSIEWGNQIRSYVFQPYTKVKDHRTDYETGDVQKVMDGDIDDLIHEELKRQLSDRAL